jgi:hypothetical protein
VCVLGVLGVLGGERESRKLREREREWEENLNISLIFV